MSIASCAAIRAPVDPGPHAGSAVLNAVLDDLAGRRVLDLPPGGEVYGQGEPATQVYRILSGVVRTTRLQVDGRRQVTDFLHAGDLLGPEAGVSHSGGAEAVTAVRLQPVDRRALAGRMATDPGLAGELWRLSLAWCDRQQAHMVILARQGAVERVAGFLAVYAARIGADSAFDLPMTRQDIADYLGLTLHTVSRTLSQMQADHWIDLAHRRVRLRARERLLDFAA